MHLLPVMRLIDLKVYKWHRSHALIALVVERTLGKGKVTCSNHVESTSSAFGEMDIIPGFEPGGGSSILSGPAI